MGQGHPSQSEQCEKVPEKRKELRLLVEQGKGCGRRVGGRSAKEMNSVLMASSCTLIVVGATWDGMTEPELLFTAVQQITKNFVALEKHLHESVA